MNALKTSVSVPEMFTVPLNTTKIVKIALNISEMPNIYPLPYDQLFHNLTQNLTHGCIATIYIIGLMGNGRTIYLLAYFIIRIFFTTYILNLSIADLGVLLSLIIAAIFVAVLTLYKETYILSIFTILFFKLFFFAYSASQFLLTAISLDRCVAALFPLWHHCHLPPYLSTLVCGIVWILCFLLSAVHFILYQTRSSGCSPLLYQLIVNGLLCTPLMVVSTVTLLVHMRSKAQHKQRKLLIALLLALLFFLLFSFPMDAFYVIEYLDPPHYILVTIGMVCASLNSSINPLLYFLVRRNHTRKDQTRVSLKVALQIIFKDEQSSPEQQQTMEEDQL